MTRTVADAARAAQRDGRRRPRDDADHGAQPGPALADYTTFLDPDGLKGARIGVMRNFFGFHDERRSRHEGGASTP